MNLADGKSGTLLLFVVRNDLFFRHETDLLGEYAATKRYKKRCKRRFPRDRFNTKACGSMTWNHRRLDLAERAGFEPAEPVTQFNSLANCRYRPLSHLSHQRLYHTSAFSNGQANLSPIYE